MSVWVCCLLQLPYCHVCSLQPCCHMLGKGLHLGPLVCDFVIFPYCVLGLVWYSIVTIPYLCLLVYSINPFFSRTKTAAHKDIGQYPIQSVQILTACGLDNVLLTTVFFCLNQNLTFSAPSKVKLL